MRRAIRTALVWSLVSIAATATASAHHSFAAAYDMTKPVTCRGDRPGPADESAFVVLPRREGTDGKATRWAFEAGTPSGMIRNGYKASEMAKGDTS